MFIHQKGLLLIVLYFSLSLTNLLIFDKPINPGIEQNISSYNFYLDKVKGACTKDTEIFILKEQIRISEANSALQNTYKDYYDGYIKEDELLKKINQLKAIVKHEKGFELLYEQYIHVRENTANRYFLYTNGWDGLLSHESLDFLFVLLLLMLISPVFCYEYDSKMNSLILTEKKGAIYNCFCKIGLCFFVVTMLCILEAGMRYVFFQFKYGLPHGDYPLQSLLYFATSSRDITLLGTFLEAFVVRLFGSLCFAVLILFLSVCVKKYSLTLFVSTVMILLPYYGLSLPSSKYFLPGPLGFIIATGFFRGAAYHHDPLTQEKVIVFQEISDTARGLVFIITLILAVIMLTVVLRKHSNVWCIRKPICSRRVMCLILLSFIITPMFSGCTTEHTTGTRSIYNMELKRTYENEAYLFHVTQSKEGENQIVFENKATAEKQNLVRNPMKSLVKLADCIYGNGDLVYYIQYDYDESRFFSTVNHFSIIEVDTRNFSEKIVFERNLNTESDSFLGMGAANDVDSKFFTLVNAFFIDNDYIYFVGDNDIRRVDQLTGETDVIIEAPVLKTIAFDGKTIFYINSELKILQYDVSDGTETELPNIITDSFLLTKDNLIFLNRIEQNRIYILNRKNGTLRKITDESALSFSLTNGTITYTCKSEYKEHKVILSK